MQPFTRIGRRLRTEPGSVFALFAAVGVIAWSSQALAQGTPANAGDSSVALDPSMSIDPSAPQVGALPGGLTPAYHQRPLDQGDWRFDFHGFVTAPLNMGFNQRKDARAGQSETVLHAPPVVPDDRETFSHTGVVPTTYAQLNFAYGNTIITGNVSIVAKQANVSTTFLEPASQLGITDVYLSILPDLGTKVRTQLLIGAFTSRYGATGEYDEGRYGTPILGRISGVGEQGTLRTSFGDVSVVLEQGIHGQTNKASSSITPDVWNNFADPGEGSTFIGHFHAGAGYRSLGFLGVHFLRALSRDDRAGALAPDGNIDIVGADLRLTMGRFGHFYAGYSHTDARQARPVSRVISVLNTQGGKGLMDNYLGPNGGGTGKLDTLALQYDLSIGKLVAYPTPFAGDGPDLFVSLFGLLTHVSSKDKTISELTGDPKFEDITKRKFGIEATYSLLPWFAASARYDQVDPNSADDRFSFAVLSPRLIFRTDWQATDQIVLQYSHWFNGALTTVRTGDPPIEDITAEPDTDMLSLSASMWW